ncbi:MAG TPA: HD domain-containing protein [Methylomusa anaerophila]|uniref:Guanosine pentaphosphate phosphohydrolase n=1 Tax=Methylomusa anaerophila TaxID=1930071 RepID=A0A348AIC2_9FIRM|nr:HD domain-containing protein [Methylomusa anaerophila]BBB90820.1 guanosine pentaphosphate phosphohydrolase [Methylomusa anaerophila]HML90523.1 HD domain-containing protein [Methylomusa anaerophila]
MAKNSPNSFTAIHVGSEQISLQIVEYTSLDDIKIIDHSSRSVGLGEETFKTGRISFSAVSEICELLKGYRRLLREYGVRDYLLVATTAIREAQNQAYIIDQIKIKTGFNVEIVDMPQEIFYKYVSIFNIVNQQGLTNGPEGLLFVDISSGGLGITLYKDGVLNYQQNIHIGALRIKESFDKAQRDSRYFHQALSEYIYSVIEPVEHEMRRHDIKRLVLSGTETRLLLKMLGKDPARLVYISLDEFSELYRQVKSLNLPQIMNDFDLTEQKAEIVFPTIVLYKQILALTNAAEIIVPSDHFIDGVTAIHIMEKTRAPQKTVIEQQIISLAHTLGRKYQFDTLHSVAVEKWSLLLFDCLCRISGLGERARLLLRVAAILHDIGKYVSLRRHYFYSYRLIASSDILGFSETEKQVIANVAYYHSTGTPADNDENYAVLSNEQKVMVSKLSAIIRLADAIDRSHKQKVKEADFILKGDEMIVTVAAEDDISLEEWTFVDKAEFFEAVFGIRATLIRRTG